MESVWRPRPDDQRESNYKNTKKENLFNTIIIMVNQKFNSLHRRWCRPTKLIIWRFLEVHMIKAVILAAFICGISEICCFNYILIVLSLTSVIVNHFFQRILIRIITFWICCLILMKMIYQIKYLDQSYYNYTCVSTLKSY